MRPQMKFPSGQTPKQNKIYIKDDSTVEQKPQPVVVSNPPLIKQGTTSNQSSRNERRKSLVKSRESFLSNPQQPNSTTSQRPKFPMTAAQALKHFMKEMNDHETGEILDYKTIYYLGQNWEKVKGSILKSPNYGYDDENGDYKVVLNDHIAYR